MKMRDMYSFPFSVAEINLDLKERIVEVRNEYFEIVRDYCKQ